MTIEYRVTEREGCTFVFGALPVDAFSMFAKKVGRGGVLDTDLARMAGADFAFGKPKDCAALKVKLASGAEAREAGQHPSLPIEASRWLGSGERGASSNAIFYRTTGVEAGEKTSHPHDPADLRRCRLLLEAVPSLQASFKEKMRGVSKQWDALLDVWDTLCATMDREAPDWRAPRGRTSCRETYDLMHAALYPERRPA